ncbi:BON domain-containing protein, partial [Escherichia coli]
VPVQQVVAKFECADIKATVDEDKGTVKLSGYVSRPDDMSTARQQIAAIEGVKSVDAQLQLRI